MGKLKILKTLSRVLNGAAIADFVTSDRVTTVDDDIKNGKAAVTGLEALLTAGADLVNFQEFRKERQCLQEMD